MTNEPTPRTDVELALRGQVDEYFAREPECENARLREFVARISKQKPEKPDHWCSCGQCDRNISDAEDLLASPETNQRAG